MGQKVNPNGLRVGIIRSWDSKWFANKKQYRTNLHQDVLIRRFIKEYFKEGYIARVEIQRDANRTTLVIHTSRPGVIIGRQGEGIEKFEKTLGKKFGPTRFSVNVKEVKNPDVDSVLVAENIARQITRRVSYRRAVKTAIQRAMENGAKGIKVTVKGRLNGVEISRTESFSEGKIPLHTLRADIEFAHHGAWTTYGIIGVRVWIYKGEVFERVSELVANSQKIQK